MRFRDVALPALRSTTGGDGAVLGLPEIVDHLFDVSPLPTLADCRCRLVRARPEAAAADRPRDARLLGTAARTERCATGRRPRRAGPPASSDAPFGQRRGGMGDTGARLRAGRARGVDRRTVARARAETRARRRTINGSLDSGARRGRRPELGRANESLRRPRGLSRPQLRVAAGRSSARAGRPSTARWRFLRASSRRVAVPAR